MGDPLGARDRNCERSHVTGDSRGKVDCAAESAAFPSTSPLLAGQFLEGPQNLGRRRFAGLIRRRMAIDSEMRSLLKGLVVTDAALTRLIQQLHAQVLFFRPPGGGRGRDFYTPGCR